MGLGVDSLGFTVESAGVWWIVGGEGFRVKGAGSTTLAEVNWKGRGMTRSFPLEDDLEGLRASVRTRRNPLCPYGTAYRKRGSDHRKAHTPSESLISSLRVIQKERKKR